MSVGVISRIMSIRRASTPDAFLLKYSTHRDA